MSTKVRMPDGTWKKVGATIVGEGAVAPVLEELTITENGEYTPSDGADGFSKVIAAISATCEGATMLSGSFTPSENVTEYTLAMSSPISNFIYRMNPVTLDGAIRTNVAGVVLEGIPYIGLSTNGAGTSVSGVDKPFAEPEISEDGLSVTIRPNYTATCYLLPHNYDWIAW